MLSKTYVLRTTALILLLISVAALYFYLKKERQLAQRHHLVCEVLKPGMSKDEVLNTLRQVGYFTTSEGDWGNGNFVVGVNFTDQKIHEQYGNFEVAFENYKYFRAVVPFGSDNPEIICDFYNLLESTTATPSPP
jgi:hypothetical protein